MTHDEAEFLISQRLDGTLDAADEQRLRAAIDTDSIVAAMWREHLALDAALRGTRVATNDLSSEVELAAIAGRIDDDASRAFRIGSPTRFNWATPLAAAATLAVGLTIGLLATRSNRGLPSRTVVADATPVATTPSIALSGSMPLQAATGRGFAEVQIGTPTDLTPAAVASLYVNDRVTHSHVMIQPAGYAAAYDVFE